ncbi:hypothetical protein KL86PLE_30542 [uncultured Pleomorphomonas sp.]|uniref:Uncharacterized protein n=1 Tax=uncultured Pleomorphomonas sp. TaxID=442121 RepID=A0A212LEX9_9HYPH|nr:hypothetical protein KL86PLE_30542 [uncultured Pleomorphomonas sp.]
MHRFQSPFCAHRTRIFPQEGRAGCLVLFRPPPPQAPLVPALRHGPGQMEIVHAGQR